MSCREEIEQYLSHVERETHESLPKICTALEQSGLNFDKKFVQRFIRFASNRVCESYDNFAIDAEFSISSGNRPESMKRDRSESDVDLETRKKHRSKSPLSDSFSRTSKEKSVILVKNWQQSNLDNSALLPVLNIEGDSLGNGLELQITSGTEQTNEEIANELTAHSHRLDKVDQNQSLDSSINSNGTAAFCWNGSTTLPHAFTFACFHCSLEVGSNCQWYDNPEAVNAHWLESHQEDETFKFQLVERVTCYFCGATGLYQEIFEHQKQNHADESIVIAAGNNQTCALCPYKGGALMEHFSTEHSNLRDPAPITLTDELLNWLFQTDTQATHPNPESEIFDQIEFVICGCKFKINPVDYFNHIENHRHNFVCAKCPFKATSLVDLVNHDKDHKMKSLIFRCIQFEERLRKNYMNTKIIFKKGLVVAVRHLINTKFDVSELFEELVDRLVVAQKTEYNRVNETTEKESSDSNSESCRSISSELEAELEKQKELINDIFIYGIPYKKNEGLFSIVMKMFKMMRADVQRKDIEYVSRPPRGKYYIIVRFTNFRAKAEVMERQSGVEFWASDFVKESRWNKSVMFSWGVTKYFAELHKLAKDSRSLYSYRWTEKGLFVQRTIVSKGKYVFNVDELLDYLK